MNTENGFLSESKGRLLLALARKTISERLGAPHETPAELETRLEDPSFDAKRGTFVTLKIDQQLRGCIGNLGADVPIRDSIAENAVNAAFNDPRFSPLIREELKRVQIEISLLTEPHKLDYTGHRDLLDKLVPGVDGVLIRKGIHSATFLPQVWEQIPHKEEFLRHLCLKAGLAPDEWAKGRLFVYTYRVAYFEEPE